MGLQVAPSFPNFTSTALNSTLTFNTTYHRIPLGCSCLMTTTLPEAILPKLPTQYFGGRATGWVIIRQLFDTRRCAKQLILRVTLLDIQVAGLQGLLCLV